MTSFIRRPCATPALAIRLACVGAATALNLGMVAWVGTSSPPLPMPRDLTVSVVDVVSEQPAPSPHATLLVGAKASTASRPARNVTRFAAANRHDEVPRLADVATPSVPSMQTPTTSPDVQAEPAANIYFYSFNEVDTPASPVADWELDAATLDAARTPRIVFDLFVSVDGSVVDCRVVEPADMDAGLRAALESRLRSTALSPAIRSGRPVDSVRRIELFVS